MLGATHVLTGSAIYQMVNNQSLAYGLAFGSHYLLDLIPHYELSTTTNYLLLAGAGLGLGVIALKQKDWGILIAGLLSALPDIIWQLDLFPVFNDFHFLVHTKNNSPEYGLLLESVIDILAITLIARSFYTWSNDTKN